MTLLRQLAKHFLMVASLLSLSACGSMQISNIRPTVRLPASGDCFGIHVLTHEEVRLNKPQCEDLMKRAVFLTQEDWQLQRYDIQKNCQLNQCKQLVGAMDALFLAIDAGLKKVK